MARPNKNNAEYFSHDNSMRNHRKIKALRQKYGTDGYSVYLMLLETLTGSNNFEIKLKKELDFITLAGDFGIENERLKEIINFIEDLELIQNNDGFISCESLNERMQPLIDKRMKSKELASNIPRDEKGRFLGFGTNGVSEAETPQSKTKESKEKESKEETHKNVLASAKNNLINKFDFDPFSTLGISSSQNNFSSPKPGIPIHNQWQEEATNAYTYLEAEEDEKASIFRLYKENKSIARTALSDCKELGKKSASYFFKVYNDISKNQTL